MQLKEQIRYSCFKKTDYLELKSSLCHYVATKFARAVHGTVYGTVDRAAPLGPSVTSVHFNPLVTETLVT